MPITLCILPSPLQWEHPSVVVVVYDVTNEQSFKSCAKWLERVRAQKPEQPFPGVVVYTHVGPTHRHTHVSLSHIHTPVDPSHKHTHVCPTPVQVCLWLTRQTSLLGEWWVRPREGTLQQRKDSSTLSALQ